ncbi:MAG: hypothetical protein O6945_15480, partial [Gammaproteobacteria bacterium]|nr:hypothetical protein [Gammaproteobacteria bacterium]
DSNARINSLIIASAQDVELDDVYAEGTVGIDATGDVHISGVVDNTGGDVTINAGGSFAVDQSIIADNDVTLVSSETIESLGLITSGGDTQIVATGSITLGGSGGDSINAAGNVSVTSDAGDISLTNVTGGADVMVISVSGKVIQAQDTVVSAGGSATVSALNGIEISSINATNEITLVITQSELAIGEDAPTFSRVNEAIPIGQGNDFQDINSEEGAIVFLAPVADVGSAVVGQNFVQRADVGIFYGLEQGQFFSDDIGGTAILNTIPGNTLENLSSGIASSIDLTGSGFDPVFTVDVAAFNLNLVGASNAEASAGETAASSSSRSTAASQQDDEEEVAEVDEVAFQSLKNYDENPQGILLPDDQRFTYDDRGNIYFIVTLSKDGYYGQKETFTLYRVDLDLHSTANDLADEDEETEKGEGELVIEDNQQGPFTYQPSFLKLSMSGADSEIGGDE